MMNTTHRSKRVTARSFWASCAALLFLMLPMGCRSARPAADLGTYYTQCSVVLHRDAVTSTNYRSGDGTVTLPINTAVELLGTRKHQFNLREVSGQAFRFDYIRKHSSDTQAESFAKFFKMTQVDLSTFTDAERASIDKAEAAVGMSRAAVVAAIGPPPSHVTRNLESNTWKYWNNRWKGTFLVQFGEDGLVSSIGQ